MNTDKILYQGKMGKNNISLNIVVREEQTGKKKVFIVNNEALGVADFGDTLDSAIDNFRKSVELFLDAYPAKREELMTESNQPLLVSRIFL